MPGGRQPATTQFATCGAVSPPPFNGSDKQVGDVIFHAAPSTVEVAAQGLPCRQFALQGNRETRQPRQSGETCEALCWVEGEDVQGERRWWVDEGGSRIWSGGTVQRPGDMA